MPVRTKVVEPDSDFALDLARSAFIFAVSRRFVSENCVAMTTRHKLIMKKEPIWKKIMKKT
jgi:hypothetical protein